MKILVTGREGQVVTSLIERAGTLDGVEVVTVGRPEFDLADPASVERVIADISPDIVVSAAAYTAVDLAEDERDLAHAVNAEGAGAVARAAAKADIPIIHLSTDYVFAGNKDGEYLESDPTGPIGVYGRTKLEGERAVAEANARHVILRTAWVYSPFGKNFVKTMLRLAADRDELTVVGDQWGNPTSALDIADAVLHIARSDRLTKGTDGFGVFHLVGTGKTNWSGFARHVLETSGRLGGPTADVRDIATSDYPTKAQRPANSCLSTDKLFDTYGWRAPDWRISADYVVERLVRV
ncbi:dTDP-4-dehydrorhamnose reductase [Oryzicola mucosus]|uniref:dTDP-4-dehydrorhamnose reductase n=1 Tax=Oryzicola mucosus TaxID=2767425 RepID=A0A8J6PJC2_9HYPH|nr:dTDP-4-dehydrorhamnose reductase [Oryzicola mucosus]MBD0415999.1 dTDP-4-dehydrorhamnose reductase [Oryzicola mucosus]